MKVTDLNNVGAKGAIAEEAQGKWGMVIESNRKTFQVKRERK